MSVGMSLLAILDEGPGYGLRLRNEFEARTGGIWPLNVGQVYSTLQRLERDGLVRVRDESQGEGQKLYEVTDDGRTLLNDWFAEPTGHGSPSREELVLKLVMATRLDRAAAADVIQRERRNAIQILQDYTRLKRGAPSDGDLGWLFLLDSLIFQTEARVRWLDACEARLSATSAPKTQSPAPAPHPEPASDAEEVPL